MGVKEEEEPVIGELTGHLACGKKNPIQMPVPKVRFGQMIPVLEHLIAPIQTRYQIRLIPLQIFEHASLAVTILIKYGIMN